MSSETLPDIDWQSVPTPCLVFDPVRLEGNLRVLAGVKEHTGCRVLLALKAFALPGVFSRLKGVLDGVCASSPYEARLGREEFGGEIHVYAPAYSEADMREIRGAADHVVFNSSAQLKRYRRATEGLSRGLRVNPRHSEVDVALYDPCAPQSRLGITAPVFREVNLEGVEGLHFHTLCELNADSLERTLRVVERDFGWCFDRLRWVNMGGGHQITRSGYDLDLLKDLISVFRAKHPGVQVYLEPGEAVVLNAGYLAATVLDIVRNEIDIAILDTSAAAHMPDVLEMPYRPDVLNSGVAGEYAHTYRLAGLTCLAGDVIGDYSFREPLAPGKRVVFRDMAHYTTVKATTFNGLRLPSLAVYEPGGGLKIIRTSSYEDYRSRLS